jgi:hypothetical protein
MDDELYLYCGVRHDSVLRLLLLTYPDIIHTRDNYR